MSNPGDVLGRLAESYGVETHYFDDEHRRRESDAEAVAAVLHVLGAPLERPGQAEGALRERRQALWRRPLEPVLVGWDGAGAEARLRLPARDAGATLACRLEIEAGPTYPWTCRASDLPLVESADVEGAHYETRLLALRGPWPVGCHRFTVQTPAGPAESLVLSAPTRTYAPPDDRKAWGAFLPLYALRSARDWGVGDFTDLGNLIDWVRRQGGGLVGTLPLLAAFLDEPFEPSPYSPASRLFWNELYVDPRQAPELARSVTARALVASPEFAAEVKDLRAGRLVDYRRAAALKRRVLAELARTFFAEPGGRLEAFRRFLAERPRAEDYGRFRAAGERLKTSWWGWPERQRGGDVRDGDYDETAKRYHLYVQWLADEQLGGLARRAREQGPGLYLDYPLGVNPDSYDVWRDRDAFATGVSAGAPPDSFFTLGQDWGFPPLHPERLRAAGYRYLRDCLQAHFRFAGMLRIDHMMGLHRFFWVPQGFGPKRGVYVRYPAEELYAVFSLESHRGRAVLVGEDLGTVPPEVRPAMAKHNVRRLYIGQFELKPNPEWAVPPPEGGAVASLNTHDLPTFFAFWTGQDVADRRAQGLIDEATAVRDLKYRKEVRDAVVRFLRAAGRLGDSTDPRLVLRALLTAMAAGRPSLVLVNLEDLWLTPEPQNRPGTTWRERPNWQTRAAHPLEVFDALPELRETLRALDRAIRGHG
jgi:4-alpha-glucanotransferase